MWNVIGYFKDSTLFVSLEKKKDSTYMELSFSANVLTASGRNILAFPKCLLQEDLLLVPPLSELRVGKNIIILRHVHNIGLRNVKWLFVGVYVCSGPAVYNFYRSHKQVEEFEAKIFEKKKNVNMILQFMSIRLEQVQDMAFIKKLKLIVWINTLQ